MSESAKAAWVQFIAQRLHNHDPSHAAEMTKVAKSIIYGQVATVVYDIDSGLSPNASLVLSAPPAKNGSLLGLAVGACQYNIVKQLVDAGASVNGVEGTISPLMGAVDNGDALIAKYLIQKGAKINAVDPVSGENALASVVLSRQPEMVKLLLDYNANPNLLTGRGRMLLEVTSRSTNPIDQEIAKMLRVHGARTKPDSQPQESESN